MKKKTISAGVIVSDGVSVLLGHVTNASNWDIPKGGLDAGESALQGAIRELREETGLVAQPQDLVLLGQFDYKPKKDLILYCWPVTHMPDTQGLTCASSFVGSKGKQPELDAFAVVSWQNIDKYCVKDLVRVLQTVEPSVKETVLRAGF